MVVAAAVEEEKELGSPSGILCYAALVLAV